MIFECFFLTKTYLILFFISLSLFSCILYLINISFLFFILLLLEVLIIDILGISQTLSINLLVILVSVRIGTMRDVLNFKQRQTKKTMMILIGRII